MSLKDKQGFISDMDGVITFANAAGALAVTKLGAQVSMPRREDIVGFLSNLRT